MKNISDAQKMSKYSLFCVFRSLPPPEMRSWRQSYAANVFPRNCSGFIKEQLIDILLVIMLFIFQLWSTAQPVVEGMSRRSTPEKKISPASDKSKSSYSRAKISEVVRTMSAAHSEWFSFIFFGFPVLLSLRVWSPCIVMICTTRY